MSTHPGAPSVGSAEPDSTPALARVAGRLGPVATAVARSPAAWLFVLVGFSTLVRAALAVQVASPWILPDEVLYSDLAKSIANGGFPAVRGVHELGWGVVYPALIAPAWAVFGDAVQAYHAALTINGFLMSLAAVPAYCLARMFVGRGASMVAAAMTVLVPSMAYSGVLMTENACYPAFLLAVLLFARAVRSPTLANQALALIGLGVVTLTRIQAMALVGSYLASVALYAWTGPHSERGAYLRRFVPTAIVSVVVSIAPMALSIARGDGALGWLGSRSGTFDGLHVYEIPQWFIYLVADLVLYVTVAPAAATAIVLGRGLSPRSSETARLFTAVALPTLAVTLASVALVSASVDVDGTENLNERYIFYVVPLLFVGLAVWVREGLPRPRPWAAVTLAVCCLLPALLPIGRLAYNASFQSIALLPWLDLDASSLVVALLAAGFTLACGALWLTCCLDRAGYLWLVAALWMSFVGTITVISNQSSASGSANAFAGRHADWVDRAVPDGARVSVLWRRGTEQRALPVDYWLMVTEFFNEKVGDVYRVGGPTYYESVLPTVPVGRRPDGSVVDGKSRPLESSYVLVSCRTPVNGRVVAQAPGGALQLIEIEGQVRLTRGRCSRATP
jgi:hypothetical protein